MAEAFANEDDNNQLKITRIADTNRGVMRLLCCGYMYYFKTGDLFVCKCKKGNGKQCYSSITLDKDNTIVKVCGKTGNCSKEELIKSHGHKEVDKVELLALDFEKSLKSRSAVETKPLPQIYQEEQSKFFKEAASQGISDEQVAGNFKTFQSLKSSMYDSKHKNFPNIPKSLDEIQIKDEFAECEDTSRFLISDTWPMFI